MMYKGFERERSRQKRNRQRSQSDERYDYRLKQEDKKRRKTVKRDQFRFTDDQDIKVFKKDDEPTAKGITQTQLLQLKNKMQREHQQKDYLFNSEQIKHLQARRQKVQFKQQKQKQKTLNQRLIAVKEQISYYTPKFLKNIQQLQVASSLQKEAHSNRIANQLGCYYSSINQIPNQPTFQILNNSPANTPIPIIFDKTIVQYSFDSINQEKKDQKPLKSILKQSFAHKRKADLDTAKKEVDITAINPKLVYILQEITRNKEKYSKELIESMLQPFKESGDLQILQSNASVYQQILKNSTAPPIQPKPQIQTMRPSPPRISPIKVSPFRATSPPVIVDKRAGMISPGSMNTVNNMNHGNNNMMNNHYIRADKFKTVPCKYFHSPQGCVKKEQCTFIHDQQYAGKPSPRMMQQGYLTMGGNTTSYNNQASNSTQGGEYNTSNPSNPNSYYPGYQYQNRGNNNYPGVSNYNPLPNQIHSYGGPINPRVGYPPSGPYYQQNNSGNMYGQLGQPGNPNPYAQGHLGGYGQPSQPNYQNPQNPQNPQHHLYYGYGKGNQ